MKIIINENERGLLFKNGQFVRMLTPGKHTYFGKSYTVETVDIGERFAPMGFSIDVFMKDAALADSLAIAEVPDQSIALHFVNGRFVHALPSGKFAFWQLHDKHEFRMVDISEPMAGADIPEYIFANMAKGMYKRVEVMEYQKGGCTTTANLSSSSMRVHITSGITASRWTWAWSIPVYCR